MTLTNAALAIVAAATAVADRAALMRAVDIVDKVIEARNVYPIIGHVRLRGDGHAMFVTGTDLDINIDVRLAAAADAHFDVCVPSGLLKSILKGAPKAADMAAFTLDSVVERSVPGKPGELALDFADGNALLDFGTAKFNLNVLHPAAFPDLKGPNRLISPSAIDNGGQYVVGANDGRPNPNYRAFTMPGADLFNALDAVAFAISNEETRYYLNGVYMHVPDQSPHDKRNGLAAELRFVTTDGHRMARQTIAVPDGALGMPGAILPKKTVYTLLKLLKPAKGKSLPEVAIEVTDTKVRFMFDDVTITSKLIEGTFPDYNRVTPMHNDKFATFSNKALQEAIGVVTMIASERGGKAVKIEIEGDGCRLSTASADNGSAETTLPVAAEFGRIEIGFNAGYFVAILDELKPSGDTVTMAFNDSGSPTVITGDRAGWLSVLMPMRV